MDRGTLFHNGAISAILVACYSILALFLLTHSLFDHPPEYDELLHVLAARGVNDSGVPGIADGVYNRAELYTRLVAWVTSPGGNELTVARIPALAFGMALAAVVGLWVTLRTGWLAGFVASSICVIAPQTLHASVLVRFYTAHTLVMLLLLILWYEAVSTRYSIRKSMIVLPVSILLIWIGMHLHALTQISVLAGVCGMVALLVYDHSQSLIGLVRRKPWMWTALIVLLVILAAGAFFHLDIIHVLRGSVPLWSAGKAGNYAFYISALSVHLPFIWPLFPLMAVFAFLDKPRMTLFCVTVFIVALITNSIAAQKATRYFFHAIPMMCIVWGIGFQKLIALGADEMQRRRGLAWNRGVVAGLVVAGICLVSSHEIKRSLKLVVNRGVVDETIPVNEEPDWSKAIPYLQNLASSVDTLVVTSGVKGLYTFGRYDYELSSTVVQETDTGLDFGKDLRTGRMVVSRPESARKIMSADGQSLFVLENRMLNRSYSVPEETVDVLNQECSIVDLSDSGSQLTAWLC